MLRVDFARLLREGDMSQNIYLQPDDFIYVPSTTVGNVHVLGAVNLPRSLDYANELTLVQAVSQAGGIVRREAHLSHVAIVRGTLVEPQIAVVDLNAILSGKAPDIALQPQDIVFVPFTPYRVLNRYVDLILDTFVRTVGVNEGARAAGGTTQVGVSVPVGAPL
jgi:protein involved in polysaccharide export with SLBB domain